MQKIIYVICCLFISLSANSSATNYSFTLKRSDLVNSSTKLSPKRHQVITEYQWLTLRDFPNEYRKLFDVPEGLNPQSLVLFVKSRFTLTQNIRRFNKDFYRDEQKLSQLSGMNYRKTLQTDNYLLSFKPIFFKKITARARLVFPNNTNKYQMISPNNIQSFLVHLKSYDFSSDLYQSDIISVFESKGANTQVSNISFAILTDLASENLFLKAKKSFMINTLNKQSKEMINVFTNVY